MGTLARACAPFAATRGDHHIERDRQSDQNDAEDSGIERLCNDEVEPEERTPNGNRVAQHAGKLGQPFNANGSWCKTVGWQ